MDSAINASFLIKRFDETAVFNTLHDRHVVDQIRIGLLLIRQNFDGGLDGSAPRN